jgi:hypothetical protein
VGTESLYGSSLGAKIEELMEDGQRRNRYEIFEALRKAGYAVRGASLRSQLSAIQYQLASSELIEMAEDEPKYVLVKPDRETEKTERRGQ